MNPFGEIVIVLILSLSFGILGYLMGKNDAHADYCASKGAIYVKGLDNWTCVKGEKI